MTSSKSNGGGRGLTCERDAKRKSPRVVLAGGPNFAPRAAQYLYLMGLDVCSTEDRHDLHALAVKSRTAAVVLPVEAGGESGFLTCAKLRLARPKLKVVLVGEPTPRSEQFARFLGAGFATESDVGDAVMKLI